MSTQNVIFIMQIGGGILILKGLGLVGVGVEVEGIGNWEEVGEFGCVGGWSIFPIGLVEDGGEIVELKLRREHLSTEGNWIEVFRGKAR